MLKLSESCKAFSIVEGNTEMYMYVLWAIQGILKYLFHHYEQEQGQGHTRRTKIRNNESSCPEVMSSYVFYLKGQGMEGLKLFDH